MFSWYGVVCIHLIVLICINGKGNESGERRTGFFGHYHDIHAQRSTTSTNKALFPKEDFAPYINTIAYIVRGLTWNKPRNKVSWDTYVTIVSHHNCSSDENVIKLTTILKRFQTVHVNCYQVFVPFTTGDIEYLRNNRIRATIFLLSWYTTEGLLEQLARYGIDGSDYVTIGISQSYVRYIKSVDSFMRISNILVGDRKINGCIKDSDHIDFVNNASHSNHHHEDPSHASQGRRREKLLLCYSIESRPLLIATTEYSGDYIFRLPGKIPDPNRMNACTLGSLPCRKSRKVNKKVLWDWYCCRGYLVDYIDLILDEIGRPKYEIYFVEDGQFGSLVNGKWTGIINDVHLRKADLGVHLLNAVSKRFTAVDFTFPVRDRPETFGVLVKKTERPYLIINWSFLRVMETELLLICFVLTFLIAALLIGVENLFREKRYPSREGFSSVFGILLQRDLGGVISHTWTGQTFSTFFALGMTVFVTSYTAHLTAKNIDKEDDDFKGLEDKKFQDPSYRVGIYKGGASEMYYNRLPNMRAERVYFTTPAYQALQQGLIDGYVVSSDFVMEFLNGQSEYSNVFNIYRDKRYQMEYGFAIQKNSVIGDKLSRVILKLDRERKLHEIIEKWVIKKKELYHNARFPWEYAGGFTLVLGVTVVVCVFILLLETLYTFLKRKRKRKYAINGS